MKASSENKVNHIYVQLVQKYCSSYIFILFA